MEAIDKAFKGKCSPLAEDFLRLLCNHDRMAHLRLIALTFQALRDKLGKPLVVAHATMDVTQCRSQRLDAEAVSGRTRSLRQCP